MSWGAVIAGGAALIGGAMQSSAGNRAADAAAQGNAAATAEARRQYDQTRQDLQPWMDAGGWALGQQRDFMQGDYSAALNSPDYQAALQEGFKGLDRGATSQGNLWGGGTDADRMRLGQNLASQQIGNYYNRLAGMSNTGQTTGNQLGAFGQQYGMQAGQNAQATGNTRASAYANSANAWGNAMGQIGSVAMERWGGG